ncbi:MAG: hypothetical protein ABII88_11090 [Candidatus Omnitrophota bacterium]
MNNTIKMIFVFTLGVLFLVFSGAGHCAMLSLSPEELTDDSDEVIIGRVISKDSHWNEDATAIVTDVKVQINEVLKGEDIENPVTIEILGGVVGEMEMKVSDAAFFEQNEEVVLFLSDSDLNIKAKELTGNVQGKYSIKENLLTGQKEVESAGGVRVSKVGQVSVESSQPIAYDEFIGQIKQVILDAQEE